MINKKVVNSKGKNIFLLSLFFLLFSFDLPAQSRGSQEAGGVVEIVDARKAAAQGKQWAVFIAIDEYSEQNPLLYPVKDAREIKKILLENYYIDEVRELYNKDATAAAIRRLFIELQEKTGINDSVFVFHAGHGINYDKTKTSAWLPYNAGTDELEQNNWLTHKEIRSLLDAIKAKHVFLISDSCYSGDLLDGTRGMSKIVTDYPAAYNALSRQAMSSGASEQVADESEFASRLKSTLLRTETPYLTPDTILSQIKDVRTARKLLTQPLLAVIPGSQHQLGGSFLFFRKNPNPEAQLPSTQSPAQPPASANTSAVNSPAMPFQENPPTIVQGASGESAYFIGTWIATVEYNKSFDTYEITMTANGRCTVKLTNDDAEQETTGNWSYDEKTKIFKLNAVFRNAKIAYQRNIQWVSPVSFADGNNSFNILAKPADNAANNIRFTFFRE